MNRYWVSWIQETEDYRPLNCPPNRMILGWWCSGIGADDKAVLCAVVEAEDVSSAIEGLKKDWPETAQVKWRFFETVTSDFNPGERFLLEDWMKERLLNNV